MNPGPMDPEQPQSFAAQTEAIDASEINRALTMSGTIPQHYSFLMEGSIYVWNPSSSFQLLLIEADELADACRRHLLVTGRVFPSLKDAAKKGIAERWENWEKLVR